MDGDTPRGCAALVPLVPPRAGADPMAAHRHGLDLAIAASRLALAWLEQAAAQHVALTRRALGELVEGTRGLAAAGAPPEQARATLEALHRAHALGVEAAHEIASLMQRMPGDTLAALRRAALNRVCPRAR